MSSSGRRFRHTMPTPSPVRVCAFEVVLYILPKPPVAKITALAWNTCSSPVASSNATTPAGCWRVTPSSPTTSTMTRSSA